MVVEIEAGKETLFYCTRCKRFEKGPELCQQDGFVKKIRLETRDLTLRFGKSSYWTRLEPEEDGNAISGTAQTFRVVGNLRLREIEIWKGTCYKFHLRLYPEFSLDLERDGEKLPDSLSSFTYMVNLMEPEMIPEQTVLKKKLESMARSGKTPDIYPAVRSLYEKPMSMEELIENPLICIQ